MGALNKAIAADPDFVLAKAHLIGMELMAVNTLKNKEPVKKIYDLNDQIKNKKLKISKWERLYIDVSFKINSSFF